MTNLFFDDNGSFKAGAVLSADKNTYQVELPTGRRTKVKQAKVYFEFASPAPAQFMEQAQAKASELDPSFLWEVAPQEEFAYEDLAREYYGAEPSPVERAALLLALFNNPVYFYRKGRGRFRPAPEETLKRALEALERRRRQEERRREITGELIAGRVPPEIAADPVGLLVHPDKNSIEWKALCDAAAETRRTPLKLLLSVKAIGSPWQWHVRSFYEENFPEGAGFPDDLPQPPQNDWAELPLSDAVPFSIDDSSTTEIDDATSVTPLGNGRTRVGIHIAAPSLGMKRGDAMDQFVRGRMSTVYAPGLKTTMLPESWVKAFSLDEGKISPCLSLYAVVDDATFSVLSTDTRLERVRMDVNLRYDQWDGQVTEEAIESGGLTIPHAADITYLWRFARHLQAEREKVRGRPEPRGKVDWYFDLEGEGEDAVIHVKGRRRGEPLDLLVGESMIFANSTWGAWLEEHETAGIYRSQRMGRVRMSTTGGPHDGLGVARYSWCTSPLRRYVDLVNQQQIIAVVMGEKPPYERNDADFFSIVETFETIYESYKSFQIRMERYWSLRWIEQEGLRSIEAAVVKDDLVRIDGLPFMQRVPGLPELERGQRVMLDVVALDYVDLVLEVKLREVRGGREELGDPEEDPEQEQEQEQLPQAPQEQESGDAPAPQADPRP
ncbi:RNB domain-containing ribonuclease [Mesosutterella sp. OilRF-GAM-744-9]|uniref:RNB domain-containing ribonuclease n=1 Tax=Mesosutterella porci TaxID=2915351 RepID=A0ABS9MRP8_9BURK|nr:ribonuclease catalytic domain-containing protein [Mesosutterella sp. oilRF-744-WT-GAM-9]MCG5031302.1 RNB domain-containing ribonuclease [Mesosutterella sp. oilRF-744-WT-GAM-9]